MALVRDDRTRDLSPWHDPLGADEGHNPVGWKRVLWIGYGIVFMFFGVFGLWAALAPLESGAVAQGQVQVSGNQRIVQHLEGGLIQEILVREGDRVKAGQPLIVLDPTRARTQYDRVHQQYVAALGREARLLAERANAQTVQFPGELTSDPNGIHAAEIVEGERRLFEGRRAAVENQLHLLDRRIAKAREEIAALKAQQRSDRRQLAIIDEEIFGVRELYEKGLERKPRLLALQRTQAELEGSIDNREALMARASQTIAETEFQKAGLVENTTAEIETDLRTVQNEIQDLRQQLTAARDALNRTTVTAPESGQIYGLRFHTRGGVIAPGDPILNLVPEGEELIVRAQLDPNDIDSVHEGALATVRLTSFNQRTFKPIEGHVTQISPDVVRPEQGPPFYEARIRLDPAMLKRFEIDLVPGMPALAIISTGEQTMLDYLIAPIARSLETALREK
ncbi:HlyD family type I secretion periplasmic adaptor subunit [Thalassobaculum fulvum]|uniref:Membrane fusion protein (MFP) family protein n=1 Tax=Thalassobaculum fulvum TaxID=1633335 RepID=A0A918XSZ3_9PROT|nr:HlyD family type I secretion periplasmic adaptor subunit [Thalassobaculum fulvum]GHD53652.1 HlyD family type I secretion periplasmic adaptor subunit [Thalassobaculum fulvum]